MASLKRMTARDGNRLAPARPAVAALLLPLLLAMTACTSDGPPVPPLGLSGASAGMQAGGRTSLAADEEIGDGGTGPVGQPGTMGPATGQAAYPSAPMGATMGATTGPTGFGREDGAAAPNLYGRRAAALPGGAVGAAPTAAAFPSSGAPQPGIQANGASPALAPPPAANPAANTVDVASVREARAAVASGSAGSIRFMPVIGAPVSAVTPLSKELGIAARNRGLAIKTAGNATTDNILKGYFSAVSDAGSTTVVYVWDVLDNSGNRIHRIQGKAVVKGEAADPWTAVPASTMGDIADRTVSEYLAWRSGRTG